MAGAFDPASSSSFTASAAASSSSFTGFGVACCFLALFFWGALVGSASSSVVVGFGSAVESVECYVDIEG